MIRKSIIPKFIYLSSAILIAVSLALTACNRASPTETPLPFETPTSTPRPFDTPTPMIPPAETPTAEPTAPAETPTVEPTATVPPAETPTVEPTATVPPAETPTVPPAETPTPEATPTVPPEATPTVPPTETPPPMPQLESVQAPIERVDEENNYVRVAVGPGQSLTVNITSSTVIMLDGNPATMDDLSRVILEGPTMAEVTYARGDNAALSIEATSYYQ